MLSPQETKLFISDEIEAARLWCLHKGFDFEWVESNLEFRISFIQKNTGETFYLKGQCDQYPQIPPVLFFTDSNWSDDIKAKNFPNAAKTLFGTSIFHGQIVICAPFNRMAYGKYKGPHSDWNMSNWKNEGKVNEIFAKTLGDIVAAIYRDFSFTTGRMG